LYASSSQWACGGGGPQNPGIYRSTDGGASWIPLTNRLTNALVIDPVTPTTIFAGTEAGVFRSTDAGETWTAMNEGLTNPSVRAFAIDSLATTVYAGSTGGGVFARALRFALTVGTTGDGDGTVTSTPPGIDCGTDCAESYASGTSVTLTAAPRAGSIFTGWTGCDTASGTTCTVAMTAAVSVTAGFDRQRFTLTVGKSGLGRGTVTSSPAGIDCGSDCAELYLSDTAVTLTATPAVGSIFTGWSGCDAVSGRRCTVVMSAAKSVNASFLGLPLGGLPLGLSR
jgi:uncharacterized repeat protein (TIGR02543 family)